MTKRTNIQRACVAAIIQMAGLTCMATWSGTASAQEWLKDRSQSQGNGFQIGELEVHPGIGAEVGYDSNWFLRSSKTGANIVNGSPQAPRVDAGEFRITPSLSIGTLTQQRAAGEAGPSHALPPVLFNASLSASYRAFIGGQEIRENSSNVSASGSFRVDVLPSRPWSFAVFGSEVRTIAPNTLGNPDLSYDSDALAVGAEIISRPHQGTLEMRAGYQLATTIFEDSNGTPFNNFTNEASARARWTFRPQTAFLFDTTFRFNAYENADQANTLLHDSTPLRSRIGIAGLITPRLTITAMAGWGASFFIPNTPDPRVQQYDSLIGSASLSYSLTANPRDEPGAASLTVSSISVGYGRDFSSSFLSDYYGTDRGYVHLSAFFAGRFLLTADAGLGAIEYPRVYYTPSGGGDGVNPIHAPFTDARADATIFGEYRFSNALGLNATFNYQQNFSNTELNVGAPVNGVQQVYDMSWQRFQAFLGLRYFL